ncbi:FixH family protein [Alloyangia pacifica]|uniref:Nitrogen fixation protein FixH n=1 Tax=Alloyangia pacifica TaxID=311180 RepID=A0A1I6TIZ0_9RHOB|nr:FixH family protein [Alloyangia pacifica]SDH16657.1 Nitrogen fixation protein FixH [Alloyangia pacifica]SFS89145.1 Nitrogen fixation protein FixH [Alloyangia pacifica]
MTEAQDSGRKLTGWHVLAIFGGAFGVIIAVNIALAYNAIATFPGLEVPNSYVASQTFDVRRAEQEALRWTAHAEPRDGAVVLRFTDAGGQPVKPAELTAKLGRSTHVKDDHEPEFFWDGRQFVAADNLAPGHWNVWVKARSQDGTLFEQRLEFYVRG